MALCISESFDEEMVEYYKSLAIYKELQMGEKDTHTADCHRGLGYVLNRAGQCDDALVELRNAFAIFRELHGKN